MEANRAVVTQAPEPSGNAPAERLLVFVAHKAKGRWARGCQQFRTIGKSGRACLAGALSRLPGAGRRGLI